MIEVVARPVWYGKVFININGVMKETFPIKRGVRQGEPVSPLLFILAIETLSAALQNLSHDLLTINEA